LHFLGFSWPNWGFSRGSDESKQKNLPPLPQVAPDCIERLPIPYRF
jgi:hypothetical protein